MDAHGERKQVKVRKENSNEPGRVAFWWLRRSSPRDDEVWERLQNSNVDMESAGARMLWITRSISCENGEKFAAHEARKKERDRDKEKEKERESKKVSPFHSLVSTSVYSRNHCDHFLRLLLWQDWFHKFVMSSTRQMMCCMPRGIIYSLYLNMYAAFRNFSWI